MKPVHKWQSPALWLSLLSILLYAAFSFLASLTSVPELEAASRYFNDSLISRVNVTNYAPKVVGVILDDNVTGAPREIELNPATVRKVWCNATVVDRNGKDDIILCNATIFHISSTAPAANDKNHHYSNNSCVMSNENTYNLTCSCTFDVWYFANNGSWTCNMSAWDNGTLNLNGLSTHNSSNGSAAIQPLFALNVPQYVDYGELSLGSISAEDEIVNVTNIGNMALDLQLYGFGGTVRPLAYNLENNLSMKCQLGNITVGNERFSVTSGQAFADMTNLSGQFRNPAAVATFNLAQRISETDNSTKNTYWKIEIPEYSVKGQCNGTIVFNAVQNT